jgi:hypothetical protein
MVKKQPRAEDDDGEAREKEAELRGRVLNLNPGSSHAHELFKALPKEIASVVPNVKDQRRFVTDLCKAAWYKSQGTLLFSLHVWLLIINAALAATVRKAGVPAAKQRPTISPARLVNLSLYSRKYDGFMVTGWPDDLKYPTNATSLWPDRSTGSIKAWYPYMILQAFYIGTKSREGQFRLLKFQQLQWRECFLSY